MTRFPKILSWSVLALATATVVVHGCSRAGHFAYLAAPAPYVVAGASRPTEITSGESYEKIDENPFLAARENPLSTFSIDVDTASYANVRRYVVEGHMPPVDAVRIEELVNYF